MNDGIFCLDDVVDLLENRHGIANAHIEHTGGCAALFAGQSFTHPVFGTVYAGSAGPGFYRLDDGRERVFAWRADFSVGPEDQTEDGDRCREIPADIADGDLVDTVAKMIAEDIAHHTKPWWE